MQARGTRQVRHANARVLGGMTQAATSGRP
jgi:hypothetical protein